MMTDEKIKIAVAEALGCKWSKPHYGHDGKWRSTPYWGDRDIWDSDISDWAGNPHDVIQDFDELPDYANDIKACKYLIHKCREWGWTCSLNNGLDGTWECDFRREKPDAHVYAPADTMELAICQGFLRVAGKWEE